MKLDTSKSPWTKERKMDITVSPIGYVKNHVVNKKDAAWGKDISTIVLDDQYAPGLLGIDGFSHVIILFYLDRAAYDPQRHLQRRPRGRTDMPMVGIFSQRTKDRPNQIGTTSVEIVSVAENELVVRGLDAIDGTPVLDIKPYYPAFDKRDAHVPEWVDRLMVQYF